MNYSIGIFAVLFMAIANLKQAELNFNLVNEPEEIVPDMIYEYEAEEKEKFVPGKNMISINSIRGNYTVKIGQQVYYAASVHGSVGYAASAFSSDSKALPLNRSFTEYDKKQAPGLCGGDSATKYFIFDAAKAGTYEVNVRHYFRGDLENEYAITVNVIN